MLLWKFIFDAAIGLQVDGIGEGHTGEAGAEATRIDTENEGARLLVVIVLLIEPLAEVSCNGILERVEYGDAFRKAHMYTQMLVKGIDMFCIFRCHTTKQLTLAGGASKNVSLLSEAVLWLKHFLFPLL